MNNIATNLPSLIPVATTPAIINRKWKNLNKNDLVSTKNFQNESESINQQTNTQLNCNDQEIIKNPPVKECKDKISKINQSLQSSISTYSTTSSSSSSNYKIKIYHSSNDLLNIDRKSTFNANNNANDSNMFSIEQPSISKTKNKNQSKILRSESSTSKSVLGNSMMKAKTSSENELYKELMTNETIKLNRIDEIKLYQNKLVKQLKDKDITINEITKQINHKEQMIENLHYEINTKNEQILLLQDEIKKRKYDLNEMSRRIIELDQELKTCQCKKFNSNNDQRDYDWNTRLSRSQSGLSMIDDLDLENNKNHNRRPKISRLKTLKKLLQKRSDDGSKTGECIEELQSILQEKEMLITKLRLETKITNHRLTELENVLKKRDEESLVIKRNNEYFEKIYKSKLID